MEKGVYMTNAGKNILQRLLKRWYGNLLFGISDGKDVLLVFPEKSKINKTVRILNYSHILDDDRKKNAELFEDAFYGKKETDPQMHRKKPENTLKVPDGVDAELLAKVLSNPEMAALLASLAKTIN